MATSKKIQGALSLTAPTDTEVVDYNAQMKDLMGSMMQSPEQSAKDETLAWGAGLTDPTGNGNLGNALINSSKSELAARMKDRELRAQYAPMIMNALAAQQQAAQLARLGSMGGDGGIDFKGMPPEKVAQLSITYGKDLLPYWKAANFGETVKPGDTQKFATGEKPIYTPKIADNTMPDENGIVQPVSGAQEAAARGTLADSFAKTKGEKMFSTQDGVTPSGDKFSQPFPSAFPSMFGAPPLGPTPTVPVGGGALPPAGQTVAPAGGGMAPATVNPGRGPGVALASSGMAGPNPPGIGAPSDPNAVGNLLVPGSARGSFVGKPDDILAAIAKLARTNPVEGKNARQAFDNQFGANGATNPAYTPMPGSTPTDKTMQVGGPGVAPDSLGNTGAPVTVATPSTDDLPPGAIRTGVGMATTRVNENIAEGNRMFQTKYMPQVRSDADTAGKALADIGTARTALSNITTGFTGETRATAAKVLASMGIADSDKYATNAQMFNQAVLENVSNKLAIQKGTQTEGDAERAKATGVSLGNTKQYNQYTLDLAQAAAERDKMRYAYYQKVLPLANDPNGPAKGDLSQIEARWNAKMPSIIDMPSMRRWKPQWQKANGG